MSAAAHKSFICLKSKIQIQNIPIISIYILPTLSRLFGFCLLLYSIDRDSPSKTSSVQKNYSEVK